MTQSANNTANTVSMCVTAFIAPKSLNGLEMYTGVAPKEPLYICVGIYNSDHSISRIGTFSNALSAMRYAFKLKGENCPVSKNALALLQSEIKRAKALQPKEQPEEPAPEVHMVEKPKVKKTSSLEKQYAEMKKKHPNAVLLFRVGDFYECFNEDAQTASEVLGITLTRRAKGKKNMLLAGFPHHALDTYLPRLVKAGKRVAICEQLEENRA